MDVTDRLIGRLDRPAPVLATRLRYRRLRREVMGLRVIDRLVGRGDVGLDIGASKGIYSAALLSRVGRRGAVEAFEPNPRELEHLRAMARRAGNLTVHAGALSDREGTAELMIPTVRGREFPGMGSLRDPRRKVDETIEVVGVRTARLDDVLSGAERVDFVKCDVEGHEEEVLEGGAALLGHFRPIVLIEIEQRHRDSDLHVTFDRLERLGLEGHAVFGDGLRPIAEFDVDRDQLRHIESLDPWRGFPTGYVGDFVFARPDTRLGDLIA